MLSNEELKEWARELNQITGAFLLGQVNRETFITATINLHDKFSTIDNENNQAST